MKRFLATIACVVMTSSIAMANGKYVLDEFAERGQFVGVQAVKAGDEDLVSVAISPDLSWKGFEFGADVFLYLPPDKVSDTDLEYFNLRYVGYKHDERNKFTWGPQYDVTIGRGLLMDHYNTAIGGSTQYTNAKGGFLGEFGMDRVSGKALWTASNIQAGQLRYRFPRSPLKGFPLELGVSYVTDKDGVNESFTDTHRVLRPSIEGYGIDVALPIGGEFFTFYTEYAKLVEYGDAASLGARGDFYGFFNYRAEVRVIGDQFIPSLFNGSYEATSLSAEEILEEEGGTGFLAALGGQLFKGHVRVGVQYENYKNDNIVTAALGFKPIGPISGVVNYTVPIQGSDDRILEADFHVTTGENFNYTFNFKRIYFEGEGDNYSDSYSFGAVMGFRSAWPF